MNSAVFHRVPVNMICIKEPSGSLPLVNSTDVQIIILVPSGQNWHFILVEFSISVTKESNNGDINTRYRITLLLL